MDGTKKLLDWNDPIYTAGLLDWNRPGIAQDGLSSVDYGTHQKGLLDVRRALVLPRRPGNPPAQPHDPPQATDSGLDIRVFIALTELAQQAHLEYDPSQGPAAVARVQLGAADSPVFALQRPDQADLPAAAAATASMTALAAERLSEILAQNVEPDRFMLEAVGMEPGRYPFCLALLRATILGVNIFCLRMKERFRVLRPSQVRDGNGDLVMTFPPSLPLPAHSAFPGGHAFQCAAAAVVLDHLLGEPRDPSAPPQGQSKSLALAWRIALNREVAGLHYRFDSEAGMAGGVWFADRLLAVTQAPGTPMLTKMLMAAKRECTPDADEPGTSANDGG